MSERMLSFSDADNALSYDADNGLFKWKIKPSRAVNAGDEAGWVCRIHGYRKIRLKGRDWHANKIAILLTTGKWPSSEVDHINGIRSDDRLVNLRVASHSENIQNSKTRSDNVSGLKGANLDKRSGRYKATITVNGKRIHLGTFGSAMAAHMAYCEAAQQHFGQFARFA